MYQRNDGNEVHVHDIRFDMMLLGDPYDPTI